MMQQSNQQARGQTEWLAFRSSPIHGVGAFARQGIPPGTRVIEYVGERITKEESLRRCEQNNPYIFNFNEHEDLDGSVDWNPARFVNHSCAPNCDAELNDGQIWLVANRPIAAGEEVTFNYGFDLTDWRDYPCRCGSPDCVGYIVAEEFFETVRSYSARAKNPDRG